MYILVGPRKKETERDRARERETKACHDDGVLLAHFDYRVLGKENIFGSLFGHREFDMMKRSDSHAIKTVTFLTHTTNKIICKKSIHIKINSFVCFVSSDLKFVQMRETGIKSVRD